MRTMSLFMQTSLAAFAFTASCSVAAVPQYRVELLLPFGESSSLGRLVDLNNLGQVVGENRDALHRGGFLYGQGQFQALSVNDHTFSPVSLNDRGQVVGSTVEGAYILKQGRAVNITAGLEPRPGSPHPWAINRAGHVVGTDWDHRSPQHYFFDGSTSRYLPIPGQLGIPPDRVEVYDLNDHDVVLGSYLGSANTRVLFTYREGVLTELEKTGGFENGFHLNSAGHVAGYGRTATGERVPFLLRDGVGVALGTLGGLHPVEGGGYALGLNDRDWVVGQAATASGDWAAFLYRDGRMLDVNDLLVPRDAARWHWTEAYAINDTGQMLVRGLSRGGTGNGGMALLTPVPEAPAWALMLAGGWLLGVVARRRGPGLSETPAAGAPRADAGRRQCPPTGAS